MVPKIKKLSRSDKRIDFFFSRLHFRLQKAIELKTKKNLRNKQTRQSSAWLQAKQKAPLGFRHIMAPRVGTVLRSGSRAWRNSKVFRSGQISRFLMPQTLLCSALLPNRKAAQMEANTEVFQDFAIQQSSVESIKLVMELKQKSDEKVRDFYD